MAIRQELGHLMVMPTGNAASHQAVLHPDQAATALASRYVHCRLKLGAREAPLEEAGFVAAIYWKPQMGMKEKSCWRTPLPFHC